MNRDIAFSEFEEEVQQALITALTCALTDAEHMPVMFDYYGNQDAPSAGMVAYTTEILRDALTNKTIYCGARVQIAKALLYAAWTYALNHTEEPKPHKTCVTYTCLAYRFAPETRAEVVKHVDPQQYSNDMYCDYLTQMCLDDATDYGQRDVGLILGETLYNVDSNHPMLEDIAAVLERHCTAR